MLTVVYSSVWQISKKYFTGVIYGQKCVSFAAWNVFLINLLLVGTKRESALVVPEVPLNPLHAVQKTALRDTCVSWKNRIFTLKVWKIRKLCLYSQAKKYYFFYFSWDILLNLLFNDAYRNLPLEYIHSHCKSELWISQKILGHAKTTKYVK